MVLRGLVRVVYQQTRVVSVLGFGAGTETTAEREGKEMTGDKLNPRKGEKGEKGGKGEERLTWRLRTARQW
jgi:hypothetical protein